jgi:V/A-type H+-transporting ATPase subunit D
MELKFQYNKTSLQTLNKQLQIRMRALPTLKNKESALRMEVKNAKKKTQAISKDLEALIQLQDKDMRMWNEFDSSLLKVEDVKIAYKKIAGVKTPELEDVIFSVKDFDVFLSPKWFPQGLDIMKQLMRLVIEKELSLRKMEMLEYARKKTTQKVNLYEKVQIPAYQEAIMKIKRFLEDEENLTKAAQKIVKTRQQKSAEKAL